MAAFLHWIHCYSQAMSSSALSTTQHAAGGDGSESACSLCRCYARAKCVTNAVEPRIGLFASWANLHQLHARPWLRQSKRRGVVRRLWPRRRITVGGMLLWEGRSSRIEQSRADPHQAAHASLAALRRPLGPSSILSLDGVHLARSRNECAPPRVGGLKHGQRPAIATAL